MGVADKKAFTVVNHRVEKIDAMALACGTAQFTDDVDIRGLLTGRLLYSSQVPTRTPASRASTPGPPRRCRACSRS